MGYFNTFKNLLEVVAAISGILGRKKFFNLLTAVCDSLLAKWMVYLLASFLVVFGLAYSFLVGATALFKGSSVILSVVFFLLPAMYFCMMGFLTVQIVKTHRSDQA